ncbi:amidohydrolase [[Muricauda] lutisoli]|uniref:Amidohydrolase n=1 Tax=[Muricauda] lutisoli TaxID=2816035 RepID=A0ABS3EUC0_9FLAO|nr:amidohydrolase [[Muricauda] lutisoli]MBO0329853.1 amidohydrolase [[Muricauda] lutisoli]
MKKVCVAILAVSLWIISCKNSKESSESTVETSVNLYHNGDILTMEGDTPNYVEALVETDGEIVFVGSKADALDRFTEEVNQIDLQGNTLAPAFLDAHGHFFSVGFTSLCANILPPPDGPGANFGTIVATLTEFKDSEDGKYLVEKLGWIIGNGYDDSQLEEGDHPKAVDLDQVSTELPVIILHQSGHLGSINTKAMEILGFTKDTPDPDGGALRRDDEGNPNGVLEEAGLFNVLFPIFAKMDAELAMQCIQKGQEEYAKKGYLTAQDGRSTTDQVALLIAGAKNSSFYIDVVAYPDITLGTDYLEEGEYVPSHSYKNKFRIGGVKLTLDGSPQGKTAWLTDCYFENPEGRSGCYKGYPVMDDEAAIGYVKTAFKNKWQMLCHSNGDAAIDQYLMAVEAAQEEFGYPDHRTVLIHGQTLRKDQIPDLVKFDIYPSLFPMHTFYWGDWHRESVLGEPRADYISPCRDVLDAGLNLTSHHDAPVTFPNSMRVLDATVNRVTRSGQVLGPNQRISPYEGLKTLTIWAANQYFEEDTKGTLTVGKLADLVILDKNPLKIDPLDIHTIEVLESIKEGETVFKR